MFWEDNDNANPKPDATVDLHPQLVKQARKSGNLNLCNRGWTCVPDNVWKINILSNQELKSLSYSMDAAADDKWWDQVDLSRLNLANNQITKISHEIVNLAALQVLDIHDNQLTDLPDSMAVLTQLTKLDVSCNRLPKIPSCIYSLTELRVLLLQNNQLSEVDDDVRELGRLEELNLSTNNLHKLPNTIMSLSNIRRFNLSFNNLKEIPNGIGAMTALQILDLSNNKLSILPSEVGKLINLVQLYLRHNQLKKFPKLIACSQLKELYCGNNLIDSVSRADFEPIVNVKILELRDNSIASIPDGIVILSVLERLDLTNNHLIDLPPILGFMEHLSTLSLEGNSFKSVRRDIVKKGTSHLLKYLRSRFKEDPVLTVLTEKEPSSVEPITAPDTYQLDQFAIGRSKQLLFSNKQLKHIPDNVVETAIECQVLNIDLSKNLLQEIPPCLMKTFNWLRDLDFSHNRITSVPSFLSSASHLASLKLSSNCIETLPTEFSKLDNLREICIANNKFKQIPSCLYSLSKLEILMASDNQIKEIDVEGLSALTVLSVLDLNNNDICKVPPKLGNLTNLRSLQLDGNCFKLPRISILAKGTDAILTYLRDKIPAD
uniref:Disease resistance R13L4/SHOC-2-like LRR domain-containing protein n=1 Tax=Strigamia maritima TaxID=126957 RepID=T1IXJ7_STRMM